MKALMIFLPMTKNWMPPPSTTLLTGALEFAGYDSSNLDMNAEFYNFMSEPENLELFRKEYKELEHSIFRNQRNLLKKDRSNLLYFEAFRYSQENLYAANFNIDMLIENMFSMKDFCKKSSDFYNMEIFGEKSKKTEIFLESVISFSLCYHNLISENSILQKFVDLMVEKIVNFNPDLIGESVSYDNQRVFIRILNKTIKQKINPHISAGGFFIYQRSESLSKQDLEQLYVDSFSYSGAGEEAIIKLADYVSGKCERKDVPGLVYIDENGELVTTEVLKTVPKFYPHSFKGIDKDKYFVPEPIFPIETTKGCYWRKCAFCFNVTDDTPLFEQKAVDDLFNQLKEIKEKYGVRNFEFVNHCIYPSFLRKFAQKIIDEKLDIRYMTFLRTEKEFDEELLSLLYKSGLRLVHWGVESGSNRILEFVDKGITAEISEKVIRDAHKVGIFSYIFIMYGFPTETEEERQMTIDYIERNKDVIGSIGVNRLYIEKDSLFGKHPEKYGFNLNSFNKENVIHGCGNSNEISKEEEKDFLSKINKIYEKIIYKYKYAKYTFGGESFLRTVKMEEEREKI